MTNPRTTDRIPQGGSGRPTLCGRSSAPQDSLWADRRGPRCNGRRRSGGVSAALSIVRDVCEQRRRAISNDSSVPTGFQRAWTRPTVFSRLASDVRLPGDSWRAVCLGELGKGKGNKQDGLRNALRPRSHALLVRFYFFVCHSHSESALLLHTLNRSAWVSTIHALGQRVRSLPKSPSPMSRPTAPWIEPISW